MHVQINYQGPSEEFGWFLPVIYPPTLNTSSEVMFQAMFTETLPTFDFTIEEGEKGCLQQETPCPIAFQPGFPEEYGGGGGVRGIEEQKGSVGPFDFTILKTDDVNELLQWLSDNNYDQYDGSAELLEMYIDQYFVALRLQSDKQSGDIEPIVLSYDIPPEANMDALTCIPLLLTSLSTTPRLPIHVYLLGEGRADPVKRIHEQGSHLFVSCRNGRCFECPLCGCSTQVCRRRTSQ